MAKIQKPPDPSRQQSRPIVDRPAFEQVAVAHRKALKLHCYRMMGSLHEADDLVQDTLLRAWRARSEFDGRGSLRGWLYTIATNACLSALKARSRAHRVLQQPGRASSLGPATGGPAADIPWLEPYPSAELPDVADSAPGPEARYEAREAVQLAFVAAIQVLPPKQRVALLLCDVLGWSAAETAELLGGSAASINSALQRARATLAAQYPDGRPPLRPQPNSEDRRLLERYMQVWDAANLDGFVKLLREDAVFQMPPWREWYEGRDAIGNFFATVWERFADYRTVALEANAQPGVAVYARSHQASAWQAHSLHVIEPAEGGIASLTIYLPPLGPALFPAFGLPPNWPA
jgi:RNA polymerase sigma-70 factor, ECF subfamily